MLANHAHIRPLGIGVLQTVGEPVRHRIAEHQHVALRHSLALLRRRRLGKILRYLPGRLTPSGYLLLKRLEYITAEPAAAAARRRPLRSAEIAEIIAEIEELRGGRSGDPDQ